MNGIKVCLIGEAEPRRVRPGGAWIREKLFETAHGANFLGFRVLPDRIRVRNDNLRRARKQMKQLQQDYETGDITLKPLIQRLRSWEAHLMHGNTHRLRRKLFDSYVFRRKETTDSPKPK